MQISVLYFATLRQRVGIRQEQLELTAGSRVSDLLIALQKRHAGLDDALPTTLVSINREYASRDEVLRDGDEVALFPPVSGGAISPKTTLIRTTNGELDMNQVLAELNVTRSGAAYVCSGSVTDGTISATGVDRIAGEIRERWPAIRGIAVVQRGGEREADTPNVFIACTSECGDIDLLRAARFGIERLIRSIPGNDNEDVDAV